ncbi:MAG TPA: Dna2/Cas4 domain-containing protein, partial [Chitinophagales bacterium]|nr:Dna2/Cas4 domain-containing protein [Chitinophagales bacterium]
QVLETEFAGLYQREDEQSFLDLLNLLYVGTTRPEDALYILSEEPDKEPTENNSVTALFISFLKSVQQWDGFQQYVFGEPEFSRDTFKKEKKPKFELYQKEETQSANLLASAIKVKMKAEALWSKDATGKIDAGNLLHEALKQIRYEGDEITVVNKMNAAGLLTGDKANELLEQLKEVIYHPGMNNLFKAGLQVIAERPLLKQGERIRIPDRVVLQNDEATIVEYKTGAYDTAHKGQLNKYAHWLEEAGVKVKEKIIFYTADKKMEVLA